MRYKRLSNRRFCALKYNIVLQGSYFSSGGFCVCCSITILFIYKVLSFAMFEPFKVIVCHSVAVWEIVKAGRVVLVLWAVGWFVGLVDSLRVGWLGCG